MYNMCITSLIKKFFMSPDTTPEVVPAAPVIEVPVAPEHFPVRAEVTYSDGSVKTFSGQSEDSLLDVSQIK